MTGLGEVADLGIAGIAIFALLKVIDWSKKRYRESTNGDRRRVPMVVECPNKVEGLAATLEEWAKQSGAQTKVLLEIARTTAHTAEGTDRLVNQHAPEGGRETWKIPARMEQLQEETRDLLKELVTVVKANGGGDR